MPSCPNRRPKIDDHKCLYGVRGKEMRREGKVEKQKSLNFGIFIDLKWLLDRLLG